MIITKQQFQKAVEAAAENKGQCSEAIATAVLACVNADQQEEAKEFRVQWSIDVSATSHEEAAGLARDMLADGDTTAQVFDVWDEEGVGKEIDVLYNVTNELPPPTKLDLNERQLASVLAGLRLLQQVKLVGFASSSVVEDIEEIARDIGRVEALTNEEIDALCEELNG